MARYRVTILRSEAIAFEVEADSVEDAENRYLGDGEEAWSKTVETTVTDVEVIA